MVSLVLHRLTKIFRSVICSFIAFKCINSSLSMCQWTKRKWINFIWIAKWKTTLIQCNECLRSGKQNQKFISFELHSGFGKLFLNHISFELKPHFVIWYCSNLNMIRGGHKYMKTEYRFSSIRLHSFWKWLCGRLKPFYSSFILFGINSFIYFDFGQK